MSEPNIQEDPPGDQEWAQRWRETALRGKTPTQFIIDQPVELREYVARQNETNGTDEQPPSAHDIAYTLQFWVDQDVITEAEIREVLKENDLGLASEEVAVFVDQTLPEIREFMQEQKLKEADEAKQRSVEAAKKYCETWGVDRLDTIAEYYLGGQGYMREVQPRWPDWIKAYQQRQEKVVADVTKIEDPVRRAQRLMEELYMITDLHPSEAEEIFQHEQKTGTFVYLDSLFGASRVLQANKGPDPDWDKVHLDFGSIGMTVSMMTIDDPDSVRRWNRGNAIDALIFGAEKPNETYTEGKRKIVPGKKFMDGPSPEEPSS